MKLPLKLSVAFLFLTILSPCLNAQLWYITRGLDSDEVAWGVDVDSSGNIYWAVEEKYQFPNWYYDVVLFKVDTNGQQTWQSTPYGGQFNEIAFVVNVHGPDVYLAGRMDSTGFPTSGDAMVLSYDTSNATLNWQYRYDPVVDYGYEEIDGLVVQPDGIYLTGWTKGQNTDEDFLIHKISLTGQYVWTNSWDYANQFDGANGHMVMDDTAIFAAGHTNLLAGSLVSFDRADGSYNWDVTWHPTANDEVLGLNMSSDSMLYTVGYFSQASSQTCVKKFDRAGNLLWTRNWGGAGTEDSRSLVIDGDSMIYVVGTTTSYGNGGSDIFVLKYDNSGTLIDSIIWGGAYDEVAKDVVMFGDHLYITGETQSFGNGLTNGDHVFDGLLLKINGRTMQAPDSTMNLVQEENANVISLETFPNPANDVLNVTTNTGGELQLVDLSGRIVSTWMINAGATSLDVSQIPTGMYFMILRSENACAEKKVVVH